MKKLNRKGFTLVELLAVIIILAIVVGITIPAVMTTTNNAKAKAFETAAQTTADWIERQYQLYTIDSSTEGLNATLKTQLNTLTVPGQITIDDLGVIESAGLKTSNVSSIKAYINKSGRVCVVLTAATNGDYKGAGKVTATGANGSKTDYAKGGACNAVTFS